ncbi:protein of unknown function [Candidatus Nitrospira inopinata]|uniref:Uncharacterized protein n=1 Tax=Candidatus Nitrospira inopinata TaxID=1715989 RepID=A0A0S4KSC2_9BACT|nr:protein of unknown function [Candidatus Nitrospira inopinata]
MLTPPKGLGTIAMSIRAWSLSLPLSDLGCPWNLLGYKHPEQTPRTKFYDQRSRCS